MKRIFLFVGVIFFIASCNNLPEEVPLPEDNSGYQLITEPLKLSPPEKVHWDTISSLTPSIRKLDFDKLPTRVFDSTGPVPFSKPPETSKFNADTFPTTKLDFKDLPEFPVRFKTFIIPPPKIINKAPLVLRNINSRTIFDFGAEIGRIDVLAVLRDSKGRMWFNANNSLYEFDGEKLRAFDLSRFSKSFFPIKLVEDKQGQIWIDNAVSKMMVLNEKEYTIKLLELPPNLDLNTCDMSGNLWCSASRVIGKNNSDITSTNKNFIGNGIYIIDTEKWTVKNITTTEGLSSSQIREIVQDNHGQMIFRTGNGIDFFDKNLGIIKHFHIINGFDLRNNGVMIKDKNNNVWCCAKGLNKINFENYTITHFDSLQNLKSDDFWQGNALLESNTGEIVMTSPSKSIVNIINPDKKIVDYIHIGKGTAGWINGISQDDKGRFWIAIPGLIKIIGQIGVNLSHLGNNGISALTEDKKGNLWIGNYSNGIDIFNPKNGYVKSLKTRQGLKSDTIYTIQGISGELYITYHDGTIDIIDSSNISMMRIGKQEGLPLHSINSILEDNNRKIWIASSSGLEVIDSSMQRLLSLNSNNFHELLDNFAVGDLKKDSYNNIWLTTTKGVYIFNSKNNTVRHILNTESIDNDVSSQYLAIDSSGRMWLSNLSGLYFIDLRNNLFGKVVAPETSSVTRIISLISSSKYIYFENVKGLNIITLPKEINPKSNLNITTLGPFQGFQKLVPSENSNIITNNGDYLWGDSGITVLHKFNGDTVTQKTVMTNLDIMKHQYQFTKPVTFRPNIVDTIWNAKNDSFYLRDKVPRNMASVNGITWDSVEDVYNLPINLEVPYTQNAFKFYFAADESGIADKTKYRYILEGADAKWSDITEDGMTDNYPTLSPGKYRFRVISKGLGAAWSAPAVFTFTINPPWWKSKWAYTAYTVILILIVWALILYRSQALKRENKILEDKIANRTAELKQSLETLQSTQSQLIQSEKMASLGELTAGIAHEIQNPLNFVNNFSEVNKELVEELEQEAEKGNMDEVKAIAKDIKDNEEKINHHGKRADAIVKGMLQHSRTTSGQKEPTDINALCDEFLRLSYHGIRSKDKSFNTETKTDFDISIGKINIIPQDIGRVLLNLFNNAFYAVNEKSKTLDKNYQPLVSIQTKKLPNKIEVVIKDNGNGIPENIINKIFQPFFTTKPTGQGTGLGLSLAYDIITKEHNGSLKVESNKEDGAKFIIEFPG